MKKILSISILLLIIINAFYSSYAFEFGTKKVELSGWCNLYFRYQGDLFQVPYVTYSNNGKTMPAFCITPDLSGVGSDGLYSYNVVANSKITDERAWKIIKNSYPYVSLDKLGVNSEEEAYYATKVALMAVLGNRNPDDYKPEISDAAIRVHELYLKLVAIATTSGDTLVDNNKIKIAVENDWQIEENYLVKTYKIESVIKDGKYKLELSGNLPQGSKLVDELNTEKKEFNLTEKFKIMVPLDKINQSYDYTLKATSTLKTYPIYHGKSTIALKQDYALTVDETEETVNCTLSDKVIENTTKIIIIKKEYGSEKKLAGVKFNLLDENKSIIQENLITNDAGEIEILHILPGKYYVQEVETLEGYNRYTDLIEVNVTLNEEVNVIVNNALTSSNEYTKETETVEVVENKNENVYKNNFTETQVVNNTIKKLPVTGY